MTFVPKIIVSLDRGSGKTYKERETHDFIQIRSCSKSKRIDGMRPNSRDTNVKQ